MREKKAARIELTTSADPLGDNPFAHLLAPVAGALEDTAPPDKSAPQPVEKAPKPVFRIAKTKKGGYPIFREKRASGKFVTIIRNVSGDAEALLALLKKHCAAGGKAFPDEVEIQGDQCEKVETFLKKLGL